MSFSGVSNIRIEPVNVTWEIEQQDCVQTIADVAGSLAGTHFLLGDDFYVWMDDGVAVDPAPAGRTGIAASYTQDDTAAAVATAIQTAVDGNINFSATVDGDVVTITAATTADVANAADADTGFSFQTTQEGGSLDLGLLQGNVESTFEEQILDITAHQNGTTVISALRQGVSAEISLTMQETIIAKLRELFANTGGGAHTPSGGTEVFGWGTSRQGDNVIPQSRRLNLHPVNAGADLSRDLTFWKAYPQPDSLTFSGEEAKVLEVTWNIFNDESKKAEVSFFCFGDYTQDLSA